MPFTRVTLINTSPNGAFAHLELSPPETADVAAPPGGSATEPGSGSLIDKVEATSTVTVGPVTLNPAAPLGGGVGDDIIEAVIVVDGTPGGSISAQINNGGAVRWETEQLYQA